MKGKFIVFEGIDGSGKSSQANLLYEALQRDNIDCILTYEPTNEGYGKKIRDSFTTQRLTPEIELKYFTLDRKEHLEKVVLPHIDKGIHVISDRYYYSTVAYQGALGIDYVEILSNQRKLFLKPDICLFLDLNINSSISRIENRGRANTFEDIEYLKNVYAIFKNLENDTFINIDASQSKEMVHKEILEIVKNYLININH